MKGIPKVEMFLSADQMRAFYNGHPQGTAITTPAELEAARASFAGNAWALDALNMIPAEALTDGSK